MSFKSPGVVTCVYGMFMGKVSSVPRLRKLTHSLTEAKQ